MLKSIFTKTDDAFVNSTLTTYEKLLSELHERLQQIDVNGIIHPSRSMVDTISGSLVGGVAGYITLENQNIGKIQVEIDHSTDHENIPYPIQHYHYIVPINVQGLEKTVETQIKPIRKRFFSRNIVGFQWEGQALAQRLNDDAELKTMILHHGLSSLPRIEVKAHCQPRATSMIGDPTQAFLDAQAAFKPCIRITDAHAKLPTFETFNIYDRIAEHIHSITKANGPSGRLLGLRSIDRKFEMLPIGQKFDATTQYVNTYHHAHKEMKRALLDMERNKAKAHARRPLL
jgi:hypothetical protein